MKLNRSGCRVLFSVFGIAMLSTPPALAQGRRSNEGSLIVHNSVIEQQSLVPLPIYVEIDPIYVVKDIILYYRTTGERIFQHVPMTRHGNGYAAVIGCDVMQTFNPTKIEYYIGVTDLSGRLLGTSGTEAKPHTVAIVDMLTGPPPSLPGSSPPDQCAAECPPWIKSCSENCKKIGEPCNSSDECCFETICSKEKCVSQKREPTHPIATVRVQTTFGTGFGLLPGESIEPYNQTSKTPEVAMDSAERRSEGTLTTNTGFAWNKYNFRLSALIYLTPKLLIGASFRGGLALDHIEVKEVKTVAPTILANVGFRITGDENTLFEMSGIIGIGAGIIQYKIPYKDCTAYVINNPSDPGSEPQKDHPWYDPKRSNQYQTACSRYSLDTMERWKREGVDVTWDITNAWDGRTDLAKKYYFRQAGMLVGELGIDAFFWLIDGFGLNIGVISDLYFAPDFALNLDLQFGPVFRF